MGWGWVLPEGSARCPHHLALSPAVKRPEDVCGPTKFRCVSTNTCIPASFHCDEESDCPDRSDEFGCSERGAGGRALGPGPSPQPPTLAPSSSRLGASHPSLLLTPSPVPPQVVTPPQELIQASRGQTVTFTCVAIGVPTPIINWRLNWGHIPSHPRCGSGSRQGAGAGGEVRPAVPARPLPLVSGGAHQGDSDQ